MHVAEKEDLMEDTEEQVLLKKAYDMASECARKYKGCSQCVVAAVQDLLDIREDAVFKAATALAGGIGLAIVGIPGLFWGTVMGFSSLIPVIGTALVWGPAVIYLLLFGKWKAGIFLLVWSIVLVGSIDNFLRPFLMRDENNLSPFYIFLAIIGGVQYFGLAGILYGPLILTFAMVMLYIYGVEYQDFLSELKHRPVPLISENLEK